MKKRDLSNQSIELISKRFKLMGEPTRLKILLELQKGEQCVSDMVENLGYGQANTSKHLSLLTNNGLVNRRKDGLKVYYSLADSNTIKLLTSAYKSIRNEIIESQKAID